MTQTVFYDRSVFELLRGKKALLVCDSAYDGFGLRLPCECVRFDDFTANPLYEDALKGARLLKRSGCDFLVAVGGGSSIDTAKCIKYYSRQELPLLAIPTTAGTGSEATHFAVCYRDGEKRSVADERLLPDYVALLPGMLITLPLYQRKCTMLDALCHAIESWWSRKATAESVVFSKTAIKLIFDSMDGYLGNTDEGNRVMLLAANAAGQAINLTTTTAPHAMSYKLTSLYGLPHGHAAALCLPKVWRYMRGFEDIAAALGVQGCAGAVSFFEDLLKTLELYPPKNIGAEDFDILAGSVNAQRLRNHPVLMERETIKSLYKEILEG